MSNNSEPTALMPFVNGRPPHLPCGPGDVAEDVLMPGDPDRVSLLTDMLDDVVVHGRRREFAMVSGKYKGHRITICSSGIGGPSTEIALVELAMLGAKRVIRIGGMSALVPEIPVGSYFSVENAIGTTGVAQLYSDPSTEVRADYTLSNALVNAARTQGHVVSSGTVATTDSYYLGQDRPITNDPNRNTKAKEFLDGFHELGALGVDMECQVVLSVSERLGLKAACLLGVHGNRATNEWLVKYEPTQRNLLHIAGHALIEAQTQNHNQQE